MKFSNIIFIGTHLVAATKAFDFWVSYEWGYWQEGVYFTKNYPDCNDEVHGARAWWLSNDVSGGKRGVRIAGEYQNPDIIEWNTGEDYLGHHTVYKDRGYKIYNVLDEVRGHCVLDTTHNPKCWQGWPDDEEVYSIFKCTSEVLHIP